MEASSTILWYDSNLDWTQLSQAIGELSNR